MTIISAVSKNIRLLGVAAMNRDWKCGTDCKTGMPGLYALVAPE